MPCDTYSINTVNPSFSDTLSDIEMLLSDHDGDVCLEGDWNTDTSRNTAQTVCFNNFIETHSLKLSWNHISAKASATYVSDINDSSSLIDHFLVSNNVFDKITECFVNTCPLNPSDHRDIWMLADYSPDTCRVNVGHSVKSEHIAWYKVSHDDIARY